jgi:hypothetical protein
VDGVDEKSRSERLGLAQAGIERQEEQQGAERNGGRRPERGQTAQEILARVGTGRARRTRRRESAQFK